MAAHIRWVLDKRSPAEIEKFWRSLSLDIDTSTLSMILPINWYGMSDLIAVDRTIMTLFGSGNPHILRQVGAHSSRRLFPGGCGRGRVIIVLRGGNFRVARVFNLR